MRAVARAFCQECAVLSRCRGAMLLFVVGILFYSFLYPIPYAREVPQKLPCIAVDQDGSTSSRALLRLIGATEGVALRRGDDMTAAMAVVRCGDVAGILVIPRDFERNLLTGRAQSVPLYCDATHLLLYRMVLQGVRQTVETTGAGVRVLRLQKQGMPELAAVQLQARGRPDVRLMYNPAGNYGKNTVPPVFVLIVQQIMLSACAMLEVKRRALGLREEGARALLGRLLLPTALALVFAVYYFRVLVVANDLIITNNFRNILLFLLPFFLASAALGNCVGSFFSEESQVLTLVLPLSLPMLFLSGFVWPPEAMPSWCNMLAQLLPDTPAITGYLLIAVRGAALRDVSGLWAQLWALALLFFACALWGALRREEAHSTA